MNEHKKKAEEILATRQQIINLEEVYQINFQNHFKKPNQ